MAAETNIDNIPSHNIYRFGEVTISSNFDNGNIGKVEQVLNKTYEFRVWTAPDNMGEPFQSKHCAWFHFSITGLPLGCVLRIQIVNTSNHSGLYKHDMRPVYRCSATNQKWVRIRNSVRYVKESDGPQLYFEHSVDAANETYFFSFTYPYTYTMLQNELAAYDISHQNDLSQPGSLYYHRELITHSLDKRRIDLITITSADGNGLSEGLGSGDNNSSSNTSISSVSPNTGTSAPEPLYAPLLSGLFPEISKPEERPPNFPNKEVVFISARVHPGEVPAQHTFKGILQLLMDPNDLRSKELRSRYVFKLIPMLNPDGVYRGHFRMDQLGHNLNRYYTDPDPLTQPAIFAAKSIIDHYANNGRLSFYMDFHAHASKRGCFIYGNVLDSAEDQIQNQLFCKLISMNSAHFDYEGCLFSREHMTRIDPGDAAKGLTAEGSGRVATYLHHRLVHSYTIECNYNTSRVGNEIAPTDGDCQGSNVTPASPFTTTPEKYTPSTWAGVGRACIMAILDIRGHNPCSRIPRSKYKTVDRVRNAVGMEVRSRKEYFGKAINRERRRSVAQLQHQQIKQSDRRNSNSGSVDNADNITWRRVVETVDANSTASSNNSLSGSVASGSGKSAASTTTTQSEKTPRSSAMYIPMTDTRLSAQRRRSTSATVNKISSAGVPPPGRRSSKVDSSNNNRNSDNARGIAISKPEPVRVSSSSTPASPSHVSRKESASNMVSISSPSSKKEDLRRHYDSFIEDATAAAIAATLKATERSAELHSCDDINEYLPTNKFVSKLPVKSGSSKHIDNNALGRSTSGLLRDSNARSGSTDSAGSSNAPIDSHGHSGNNGRKTHGTKLSAAGVALLMDGRQIVPESGDRQTSFASSSSDINDACGPSIPTKPLPSTRPPKVSPRSYSAPRSAHFSSNSGGSGEMLSAAAAAGIDAVLNSNGPHFVSGTSSTDIGKNADSNGVASAGGSRCGSGAGSPVMMYHADGSISAKFPVTNSLQGSYEAFDSFTADGEMGSECDENNIAMFNALSMRQAGSERDGIAHPKQADVTQTRGLRQSKKSSRSSNLNNETGLLTDSTLPSQDKVVRAAVPNPQKTGFLK